MLLTTRKWRPNNSHCQLSPRQKKCCRQQQSYENSILYIYHFRCQYTCRSDSQYQPAHSQIVKNAPWPFAQQGNQ